MALILNFTAEEPLSDSELLQRINREMPESFWDRYYNLSQKRDVENLSEEERAELIALSDRLEEQSGDRLLWLSALALRRGVSLERLLNDLGIQPHKAS